MKIGDSDLARWLQSLSRTCFGIDPLADKLVLSFVEGYPGWSPYNYTLNNPLRFIDPDGKEVDNILIEMLGDDGKFFAEKPKPQKAQKSQKTKSNSKSPTPTILISLDAALAALFGYNGSVGVAFNPGQGKMYGFVRHGMSAGAALSSGITFGAVDQDLEETRASGSGLKIAPEKNTTEIEASTRDFGLSVILDSKENGGRIIGGSFHFGVGKGSLGINETFQSYETKTVYYNNVGKEFNQKPSKFYRR